MDTKDTYYSYLKGLGKSIKKVRKEIGITQENMAEMLGSDYKYYQRIESGKANITMKTLLKICDKLETPPENLFTYIEKDK